MKTVREITNIKTTILASARQCTVYQSAVHTARQDTTGYIPIQQDRIKISFPDSSTMSDLPLSTAKEIVTLRGHTEDVVSLCWLGDSEVLVTGSYDSTARVWSPGQPEAQAVLQHGHDVTQPGIVGCMDWSTTSLLATGCGSGEVAIWSGEGEKLATLSGHSDYINTIKFSDNGRLLVTGTYSFCRIWGEEEGSWTCSQVILCDDGVLALVWRGEQEFFTGGGNGTIHHWRVGQQTPVQTLTGHSSYVFSLAWEDTGLLASGSEDRTVRLWRPDSQSPIVAPPLLGHQGPVQEVVWGPGTPAILASWDDSPGLRLWNGEGDLLRVLPCSTDEMDPSFSGHISFSPNGLLACRGREVQVWRPRSGQLEARLQVEGGKVCWGVGGHRLAVLTQEERTWKVVKVFDTQKLGTLRSLRKITLRAVASYLRWNEDRDQKDLKDVLDNLKIPRILQKELQLYLSN